MRSSVTRRSSVAPARLRRRRELFRSRRARTNRSIGLRTQPAFVDGRQAPAATGFDVRPVLVDGPAAAASPLAASRHRRALIDPRAQPRNRRLGQRIRVERHPVVSVRARARDGSASCRALLPGDDDRSRLAALTDELRGVQPQAGAGFRSPVALVAADCSKMGWMSRAKSTAPGFVCSEDAGLRAQRKPSQPAGWRRKRQRATASDGSCATRSWVSGLSALLGSVPPGGVLIKDLPCSARFSDRSLTAHL